MAGNRFLKCWAPLWVQYVWTLMSSGKRRTWAEMHVNTAGHTQTLAGPASSLAAAQVRPGGAQAYVTPGWERELPQTWKSCVYRLFHRRVRVQHNTNPWALTEKKETHTPNHSNPDLSLTHTHTPLSLSLSHTHTHPDPLSLPLYFSVSPSLTHTHPDLSVSHTHPDLSLPLSHTPSLSLSLSHTHTHTPWPSLSHTHTLLTQNITINFTITTYNQSICEVWWSYGSLGYENSASVLLCVNIHTPLSYQCSLHLVTSCAKCTTLVKVPR